MERKGEKQGGGNSGDGGEGKRAGRTVERERCKGDAALRTARESKCPSYAFTNL